ncbi:MAG: hypothetical protein U5K69_15510 [Balneolaceae bacterium]|nr:hypothetical protein [Balneolaceae bacterium]
MGYHAAAGAIDFESFAAAGRCFFRQTTSLPADGEKNELRYLNHFNGFPGTKFETMFMTLAVPNQGVGIDTVETTIYEEIKKTRRSIASRGAERAKTNAAYGSLDSNSGLAQAFATAEAQQGDWKKVFTDIEDIEAVTLDDLQRVANTYFTKENRTVGIIKNEETCRGSRCDQQ